MERLCVLDEYPSEATLFDVQGYDVAISNEKLADALTALPEEKRDIILLSYFLDMTDQEIAEKLNSVRSTIQYKRTNCGLLRKIDCFAVCIRAVHKLG